MATLDFDAQLKEAAQQALSAMTALAGQLRRAEQTDATGIVPQFNAYHLADLEGKDGGADWLAEGLLADALRTLIVDIHGSADDQPVEQMQPSSTTQALATTTPVQQMLLAKALLEQAAVLQELAGAGSLADALGEMVEQVAVAGLPAAGAGMVADHEWDEKQHVLLGLL